MPAGTTFIRRKEILVCLGLAAVTFVAYWQVRDHAFLSYDDPLYVTKNPVVQAGLTWEGILWAFTSGQASNWHPLTWLSHMLDCQIYGVDPGPHHITNLLFHAANTILLFLVLTRMTGAFWRPAVIAALFSLHPLHVESVAWVAERKDVLSTFFWLLTMWAYVAYADTGSMSRYVLAVVFFALGLMAKPMLVSLPFVLLLLDYWPLGRFKIGSSPVPHASQKVLELVREKTALFLLALASCVVTFLVQRHGPAMQSLRQVPLGSRITNALVSYASYFVKTIWPARLAVYYPHPLNALPVWKVMSAGVLLAFFSLVCVREARRRPYLIVGWLWFLGTLVPVIGIVQVGGQAMADRYTYVPLIGLFVAATWGLAGLLARWAARKSIAVVLCGVIIFPLGLCSRRQVAYWKNNITLFEHALLVTKNNQLAHNELGLALSKQGDLDEAVKHFVEALRITPQYVNAHINLGNALKDQGKLEKAVREYRTVLRFVPDHATAKNNLGVLLAMQGDLKRAKALFSEVLEIDPENVRARNNLGIALAKQGRFDEAVAHFSEALRLDPESTLARKNLEKLKQHRQR